MEKDTISLREFLIVLRRRKRPMLLTMLLLFVISVAVALRLPPVYRSTATMLIENQEIPQDLVRSMVTTDSDERIQVISQRVMTSANLLEIAKKYDLYAKTWDQEPSQATLARMRKNIQLKMVSADIIDPNRRRPTQATIAFTISYDSPSPRLAQKVTAELASLYLAENARIRKELTSEASNFLADQAAKIKEQVFTLERKLAEFKEQNADRLPEFTGIYLRLVDQLEREITDVQDQIRVTKQNQIFLRSQLVQLSPHSTVVRIKGNQLLSPHEQLAVLESQYVSLSARYSADHPDLVRVRNEIAALRTELSSSPPPAPEQMHTERAANAGSMGPIGNAAATKPADNPAYLDVQARLEMTDSQLQALQAKHDRLVKKLVSYQERLTQMPQVEQKFRHLDREYQSAVQEYHEVKSKETKAQLAQSLEMQRKAERFTLIEPPQLPISPERPKRALIIVLGLLLSIAGGIGMAALIDAMDQSLRSAKILARVTGQPTLAVIPYIETASERYIKTLKHLLFLVLITSVFFVSLAIYSRQMISIDALRLTLQHMFSH